MDSSDQWKRELSSADSAEKLEVIDKILKLGETQRREFGVPALIVALQANDEKIRSSAAFALAEIAPDSQEALEHIVRRVDQEIADGTNSLRLCALTSFLKRVGGAVEPVLPLLMRLLRLFNEWQPTTLTLPWEDTIAAIGNVGPSAAIAIPLLIEAIIVGTDEKVIHASTNALVKIGPAAARPLMEFVTYSTQPDCWYARSDAVMSLGRFRDAAAEVTPFLMTLVKLNTGLKNEALQALEALGCSGPLAEAAIPMRSDSLPSGVHDEATAGPRSSIDPIADSTHHDK